jgi:hypothetical protein
MVEPEIAEPIHPASANAAAPTDPASGIFSRAQWILLAVAIAISGFFIVLLSYSR